MMCVADIRQLLWSLLDVILLYVYMYFYYLFGIIANWLEEYGLFN